MTVRPVLTRPVLTGPVLSRKEAPVSRYRRWNELLELLATSGSLQVEDAARALGVSATTHHEGEASTGRLLARQASQVVVVADSSKVGRRTFARIFTAREVDVLVTDAGIAAEDRARLENEGVEVVLA